MYVKLMDSQNFSHREDDKQIPTLHLLLLRNASDAMFTDQQATLLAHDTVFDHLHHFDPACLRRLLSSPHFRDFGNTQSPSKCRRQTRDVLYPRVEVMRGVSIGIASLSSANEGKNWKPIP